MTTTDPEQSPGNINDPPQPGDADFQPYDPAKHAAALAALREAQQAGQHPAYAAQCDHGCQLTTDPDTELPTYDCPLGCYPLLPPPARREGDTDDGHALDLIAHMLADPEWDSAMLEDIADLVRQTGREIPEDNEDGPSTWDRH